MKNCLIYPLLASLPLANAAVAPVPDPLTTQIQTPEVQASVINSNRTHLVRAKIYCANQAGTQSGYYLRENKFDPDSPDIILEEVPFKFYWIDDTTEIGYLGYWVGAVEVDEGTQMNVWENDCRTYGMFDPDVPTQFGWYPNAHVIGGDLDIFYRMGWFGLISSDYRMSAGYYTRYPHNPDT